MALFSKKASLAYKDDRYGWKTDQCSQGDCREWGGGPKRWGVLYFPGLSALKGKPIVKVSLSFYPKGGYSQEKSLCLFASKRSGINTTADPATAYKGKSLGTVRVKNQSYSGKDVTEVLAQQIKAPASGTVNDTFVIYSADKYQYMKFYEASLQVEYSDTTACTAPTALAAGPGIFEGAVTLSWSGAKGGVGNGITGYELQYRLSGDNQSFGAWSALASVGGKTGYSYTPGSPRGQWVQYRVRTKGSAGSGYYSGWKNSGTIRRNSAPLAPAALTARPTVYSRGERVTLSWPGAADTDTNIARYEVELSAQDGAWKSVATVTGCSLGVSPSEAADGGLIKYRVRAVDSLGVAGAYRESAPVLREDFTGLKVCAGGLYKKAWVYVCKGGVWVRGEILVCRGGVYGSPVD